METTLFYIFATVTVLATMLAICARHPVHAIIHLVTSFFALAVIFYLLAAPLVAMFEVLIYAGAVMVLFMFVIMMLSLGGGDSDKRPGPRLWLPAGFLAGTVLASLLSLATMAPSPQTANVITAREFSQTLFGRYGIAVEIISLQLLFAVVGALYLGRPRQRGTAAGSGEEAP
jgi:NADH-quinone oxidoreductase subunit J